MMEDRGKVKLSREGAGFLVRLDPPDPYHETVQRFDDERKARGAFGGLRVCLGRRKIDLTGER